MKNANFEIMPDDMEVEVFDPTASYEMTEFNTHTEALLSEMGASDLEVMFHNTETGDFYTAIGYFMFGVDGEYGMGTMHIRVTHVHSISTDEDDDIDYSPVRLTNAMCLEIEPCNVLKVVTVVSDECRNEAAE